MIKGVLVVLCLWVVVEGRVFERCEWARLLQSKGMDRYRGISLADWVCLTKWESGYDTLKEHPNIDGSGGYGIFQINSKYWCEDGGVSRANGCGIYCTDLVSEDPSVSMDCAKTVVEDPQGISAWYSWRVHCKDQDLSSYVSGCGLT